MNFSFGKFSLKLWLLSSVLLLADFSGYTQDTLEISELEYFFDVDPGMGGATPIAVTADSLIFSVETLNTSALSVGFHVLGVRARNFARIDSVSFDGISSTSTSEYIHPTLRSIGQWGFTETRLVYIDPSETGGIVLVDSVEYFFDLDPGVGSATIIDSFSPSNSLSIVENLNASTLSFGFHTLGIRAKAVGGSWGMTDTRLLFVDQSGSGSAVLVDSLEYFFDADPGVGNATIIDGFAASSLINLEDLVASSTLELGFHVLGLRAKAVGGSWGTTETRLIYVDPSSSGGIVNVDQLEYFFDEDPGVGAATLISAFAPGNMLALTEVLDASSLGAGFHILGIRARAEGGSWGATESRSVYVDNFGTIQTNIVQMEYFVDADPGVGMGNNIPIGIPAANISEIIAIDVSAITTGTHGLHVRALNDQGEWSLMETDTFRVVNIGGPLISSVSGDTTNATPINALISFERQVVGFEETDIIVSGNGRLQAGTLADNGDGTYNVSLDSLNEGLVEIFIASGSANALNDNSPTPPSDTIKITYDITAPLVSITPLLTSNTSPALSGAVNDLEAIVEITVGGSSYFATVNIDSTWTLNADMLSPALADGEYEVEITATDVAGNSGTDATTLELTVDTTPPSITINSLATKETSPQLTGAVNEPTSSLTIEIGGSIYSAVNNDDGTWTLDAGTIVPALADGVYEVIATATDVVGNTGADASTEELVIDNVAPVVSINIQTTSIRSPELSGEVDDFSAAIAIEVDGNVYGGTNNEDGTWTLASGTISPDLTDGMYEIIVTATDEIGNAGVDSTADELTISTDIVALPPSNITATSFQANWSTGLDEKEYRVDVSDQTDFSSFVEGFQDFNAGVAKSTTVSALDFGTRYYYRVRLVNTNDEVSENSSTISVKTSIDQPTIADSTALVQIYNALGGSSWSSSVNWISARFRNWDRVKLNASRTRVEEIDLSGLGALGNIPNPFTGDAVGGLSEMVILNASNNKITGLMNFSETSITNLDVSGNNLHFDDLEPISTVSTVDYSNQANVRFNEAVTAPIEVRYTNNFNLSTAIGGSDNQYQWYFNEVAITTNSDFMDNGDNLDLISIDYDNMGNFRLEVTSPTLVPNLTINVDPQLVLAIADFTMAVRGSDGQPIAEKVSAALLEAFRRSRGFDTLEVVVNVASTFTFPDVVLGNYLIAVSSDPAKYIDTYFGDVFLWDEADTIFFRSDNSIDLQIQPIPPDPQGLGIVSGTIEENFAEDEGRVEARRRASKRKCGLRRKRTGGRTDADDDIFDLIAYGETNDKGEFEYGSLPIGTYRFFVEYPGIPLDESSFVQFDVGEGGISENEFVIAVTVSEAGIVVELIEELGVIFKYFKNLQIYPNPSSEVLYINYRHLTTDAVRVELVNLAGSVLLKENLQRGYDKELRLDVRSFEEGIYILRFYDTNSREENMMSYRIIIRD